MNIAGSGPEQGPNWTEIPATRLQLFQPGIATWEFLTGANEANAVEYFDAQGQLVDQSHAGSTAVNNGNACTNCHNVRTVDPAPLLPSGAMEDLAEQRGGIWEDTPVVAAPVPAP